MTSALSQFVCQRHQAIAAFYEHGQPYCYGCFYEAKGLDIEGLPPEPAETQADAIRRRLEEIKRMQP